MEWYIFALIAPAFFALNGVFGKVLMTNKFKSYFSFLSYAVMVDTALVLALMFFVPISFSFPALLFPMTYGIITTVSFWFYAKSLMMEEISRIVSLFQVIPIFVAVLSAIFLNEILGMQQYAGIIITVAAAIMISYRKVGTRGFLSPALKFMLAFDLIIALNSIFSKYILGFLDYWSFIFWSITGAFSVVMVLMASKDKRKDFLRVVRNSGRKTLSAVFVQEGLYFLGMITQLIAISIGYVSIVSALGSLQPFYVFAFSAIASILMPRLIKEETGMSTMLMKSSAIFLMFIGTWLVLTGLH